MKDLPNMGEKEKGSGAPPLVQRVSTIQSTSDISLTPTLIPATVVVVAPIPNPNAMAGFAGAWGRLVWDKWRWGVLIAFAVVVSRISS
jgi:ubiquitin-conjugating enzyme E2 J2